MQFDPLNNREHYNRFQVYGGMRITEVASVKPFLLAEELKRKLADASKTTLEKLARKLYGGVGLLSEQNTREHLEICIEEAGSEELIHALKLFEKNGLLAALRYIIKL